MSKVTEFDNGLTIVTEQMPQAASVAMGVYVKVGSRDEVAGSYGVSHFLEHLAFKGTYELSAKELAKRVDSFGGEMNAFTTKEVTSFQLRLLGEACGLGADILGSILTEPILSPADVDSERNVILEELSMANDEPADVVHEQLNAAVFGGHPLGREVLGTRASILAMDSNRIREFFTRYYGAGNMVVSVAGPVEHQAIAEKFSGTLGVLSNGNVPVRAVPQLVWQPPIVLERDIEQVHASLAFPGIKRGDPRRWALAVLDHIFGGGLSSRLFQLVREESGLCYSIYSDRVSYQDAGLVNVYFATTPSQLARALGLVDSVIEDLSRTTVDEQELQVAKRYLRAQLLLSKEDTSSVMTQLGSVVASGQQLKSTQQMLDEIERVDAHQVLELAQEIFGSFRQVSVVGPVSKGAVF